MGDREVDLSEDISRARLLTSIKAIVKDVPKMMQLLVDHDLTSIHSSLTLSYSRQ